MIHELTSINQTNILDAIYNGILIIDKNGKIVKCNKTGCELIGVREEDILHKHITSVAVDATLHQVLEDEVPLINVQHRFNDKVVVANQTPIYDNGELVGAISVFQEIDELHHTLNILDQKEKEVKQLRNILELLYDGIIIVDRQGLITMMNQTYCDFLGVKMEDVIGKHVTEVIHNTRMHIVVKTGQPEIGSLKGEFREDLYYRLNVFHLNIPPLRERGKDIMTTAQLILGQLNNELGKNISDFHPDVEKLFLHYHWPGNVRELQNAIERALHIADNGPVIRLEHFPPYLVNHVEKHMDDSTYSLEEQVEKAEIKAIIRALEATNGNRSAAADLLQIHRASLYRKMEKYGLLTD